MSIGMGLRGDRVHRYVTAFCPHCHDESPERPLDEVARLSARLVERGERIWLERGCPRHGLVRTLYDEDPEILSYLEEWTAPTKAHTPDVAGNFDPVPQAYLRGLPEMQTQHTCILLEDIAETCNLRCPTCFTDSSPDLRNVVPVADVLANVDQRLVRENGRLDVLMLSGGEPTLHPDLPRLLDELAARPITRILINSNGLRIAADDALLEALAGHRERVEVYLQYDGVTAATHRHHRGGDLLRTKQQALQRLSEHEIFTTLVMTAALGVNDTEMGQMVQLIVTLIHDPELIILDEPFSGLDPVNTERMKGLIRELRGGGRAVVLSTHQTNQVEELCDRVLMINHGRAVLYGDLKETTARFRRRSVLVDAVQEVKDIPGVAEYRTGRDEVELVPAPDVTPMMILDRLRERGIEINRFEIATPSLHEIFLKVVEEHA